MNIHLKRTFTVFSIAGLGVLLLAIRPSFQSNEFTLLPRATEAITHRHSALDGDSCFTINLEWDMLKSPEASLYRLKKGEENPFLLLKQASMHISVIQDNDKLRCIAQPARLTTSSYWDSAHMRYSLNNLSSRIICDIEGNTHKVYYQRIASQLTLHRSFFQAPLTAYLIMDLAIDPVKKTVEPVHFSLYERSSDIYYTPAGEQTNQLRVITE